MPRRTYSRYQRNDSRKRKHTKRWKVKRAVHHPLKWLGISYAETFVDKVFKQEVKKHGLHV